MERLFSVKTVPPLPVGGFLKQSFIDYPGYIASVVFTAGCNFRCGYCHNPELVFPELIPKTKPVSPLWIFNYLYDNQSLLDAVVITGGEPTIHATLPDFLQKIKSLNLKVKLDTNGTNPDMIRLLIEHKLVDFIAMDVKAPLTLSHYQKIAGKQVRETDVKNVKKTVLLLKKSPVKHEFRITYIQEVHSKTELAQLTDQLDDHVVLQRFKTPPKKFHSSGYKEYDAQELLEIKSLSGNSLVECRL